MHTCMDNKAINQGEKIIRERKKNSLESVKAFRLWYFGEVLIIYFCRIRALISYRTSFTFLRFFIFLFFYFLFLHRIQFIFNRPSSTLLITIFLSCRLSHLFLLWWIDRLLLLPPEAPQHLNGIWGREERTRRKKDANSHTALVA